MAWLAEDEQFMRHDGALITCEVVISEAWFLMRRLTRHITPPRAMLADGVFDLAFHLEDEAAAISAFMGRSDDVPMSLADACLV